MNVTADETNDQFDDLLEGLEPEVAESESQVTAPPEEATPEVIVQDEFEGVVITFRGADFSIPMTKDLE